MGGNNRGKVIMAAPDVVSDARLTRMRIIVGVMTVGVIGFAVVAVAMRARGSMPPPPAQPLISIVAAAFGLITLVARMLMLPAMTNAGRRQLHGVKDVTTDQLLNVYQTRMIVGSALMEGPAFFFLIAYLTEATPWALAGGLLFGAFMAIMNFPTRERLDSWLAVQRELLEQERLGGM
jgi:hypothetical protein